MRMSTIPHEAVLGIGMLPISSEYQQQLKDQIDLLSEEIGEERKSSGAAALSAHGELFDQIKNSVLSQIQPHYMRQLYTAESWCLKYSDGQHLSRHNHIVDGSLLTYTYVIDSGGSSTPLQFYNMAGKEVIKEVPAETGMIICFSNYLTHGIQIHKGNDRYILAGNIATERDKVTLQARKEIGSKA